jgi:hypothetical protein
VAIGPLETVSRGKRALEREISRLRAPAVWLLSPSPPRKTGIEKMSALFSGESPSMSIRNTPWREAIKALRRTSLIGLLVPFDLSNTCPSRSIKKMPV